MKIRYIAVLILAAILAWYGFSRKGATEQVSESVQQAALTKVETVSVSAGNASGHDAVYQASVESVQNASLKSGVSGTATRLFVRVGDRVSVGQTLATIENPGGSTSASEAGLRSAEISRAEIDVRRMKEIYDEAKRVYDMDDTHANELAKTTAGFNYDNARITLQSLLDGHIVKSPVAGTVTSVSVDLGESVALGQEVATVGKPDATKVIFFASASDIAEIVSGKHATLLFGSGDEKTIDVAITRVAPEADPATGKIRVEARPTDLGAKIIAGVSAKVSVPMSSAADTESMLIPLEALLVGQNESSVFALSENDDRAKKTTVEVSSIRGGMAEIAVKGFRQGDRIITSNVHMLDDGEQVEMADKR